MSRSLPILSLFTASLLVGCGGSSTGNLMQGTKVYASRCSTCHGASGAGEEGPNITGSMTAGIGSWTEAQFSAALRTGVDKSGAMLCDKMTRYDQTMLSDSDITAIYAFLMTLNSDKVNRGTDCP
jgi:mono/diheme cytochrome c family protein